MKSHSCFEDGGDCTDFISSYSNCNVDFPDLIANGFCDGFPYFSSECGNDGGKFCRFSWYDFIAIVSHYSLTLYSICI